LPDEDKKERGRSLPPTLNELFRFDVPEALDKEAVVYKDKKGNLKIDWAEDLEKK
jgi:hypothetical protein